jgi:outer membrane murein-binding lipoprotein Lpp
MKNISSLIIVFALVLSSVAFAGPTKRQAKKSKAVHSRKYEAKKKKMAPKKKAAIKKEISSEDDE